MQPVLLVRSRVTASELLVTTPAFHSNNMLGRHVGSHHKSGKQKKPQRSMQAEVGFYLAKCCKLGFGLIYMTDTRSSTSELVTARAVTDS